MPVRQRSCFESAAVFLLCTIPVWSPRAETSSPRPCIDCPPGEAIAARQAQNEGNGKSVVSLSTLDLSKMRQGFRQPGRNRTVTGKPLMLGGRRFEQGVGTHAPSLLWVDLGEGSESFRAVVGVDDGATSEGSVIFSVYGDGRKLWESALLRRDHTPQTVDVPLSGVRTLLLKVDPAGDGKRNDHADWAEARFIVRGNQPKAVDPPAEEKAEILTPPPGPSPRINGPKVYGCRPGNPFLYRIPATGDRPMQFTADNLPPGLRLNSDSGIITGEAPPRGEYTVTLHAANGQGRSAKPFRIVSGEKLSLTPYMGWNHWYAHYENVTDALVRRAADIMTSSGMADAGYDYVCIDDCWMNAPKHEDPLRVGPLRDKDGTILPNRHFPDMKGLADYIHSKGFKAGIYSSPGPLTCAGFAGSYGHEAQDAATFAAWGYDLLKYDWCSYRRIAPEPATLEQRQHPYRLMGEQLLRQKRDIIYNLCQYGRGDVWEWGEQMHAQSWRTSGDLGYALDQIFAVAARNAEHRAWNGPGSWNDPDYLQIGLIGDVRSGRKLRRGVLTPTEEYAFMSLWCLSAAPLVYSGDMDSLDAFTTGILCNPEVIEVNQDPLGQCAAVTHLANDYYLMVKDLENGDKAVGLCNGGEFPATLRAPWSVLGLRGKHRVRDLWRHRDLGEFEGEFSVPVPRHGVFLVRISAAEGEGGDL